MTLTDLTLANTAVGNDNPTWSFNLSPAQDYSVGMQYIDLMHSMRPWIGHRETSWGGMEVDDLKAGGYLDEDGWPTEIPPGMAKVGTVFGWDEDTAVAQQQSGRYVVTWEGEGTLEIRGDAKIISQSNGKIVFDNLEGDKWFLNITKTDPAGTGNYVRDISVVAEEHVELHEAGALFNPAWLALIEDSRELRFMDWMGTNGSTVTSWDDMPSADGPKLGDMTPIEHMVQLANETGTDPWFTMPHLADEDFIRQFAEYVHDNLDPALTVRVEYSNEMWNWNFVQTGWARTQSFDEWGENAHRDYYVMKSVETAQIWQDVFGDDPDGRLVNVIGTQTANPWSAEQLFDPKVWRENAPDTYVDPATVFDELAVTTYFGGKVSKGDQLVNLVEAIKDPDVDAATYLHDQMLDPNVSRSIPEIEAWLAQNAAVAAENGIKLVAYEGGQHMHQLIKDKDISAEDLQLVNDFMEDFMRSPEMADLYKELWDVWANVSDGAFMQFTDTGTSSKFGTWGLYEGPEDTTPRAEILEQLNVTSTPWWDAEGGDHYLQGKIVEGTTGGDTLIGTFQEDYLLGGKGNDILVGGAQNDGLHGGAGTDRAVFSGVVDDYVITVEGGGYRVTGPDGSDLLIDVEQISFEDGLMFVLDQQDRRADGTLLIGDGVNTPEEDGPTDGGGDGPTGDDGDGPTGEDGDGPTGDDGDGPTGEDGDGPTGDDGDGPTGDDGNGSTGDEEDENENSGGVNPDTGDGSMLGDGGDNIINGSGNSDEIDGKVGDDIVYGLDGSDVLYGGAGADEVYGGRGNDLVYGNSGDDLLKGNDGADSVIGAGGDDRMFGQSGNDRLEGHAGDDIISGGSGDDILYGGQGNDRLRGNSGDDDLNGGDGSDVFLFALGDGHDRIQDFTVEDRLVLNDYFEGSDVAIDERISIYNGNIIITNGVDSITISGSADDNMYLHVHDLIF